MSYPKELMKTHPNIYATFTKDYRSRYKKGECLCLVWFPHGKHGGWYAECENGSFPIPAKDFNDVLTYEITTD